MTKNIILILTSTLILAACGSAPQRPTESADASVASSESSGGYLPGDGPDANAPANLDAIPDAVPRAEPLHRYANRQYVALGKSFIPLTRAGDYKERGMASWYGKKFHGKRTANGDVYDMYAMTAAHPTLPLPSYARVTNLSNRKSVVVRVNDRGPFLHDRIIDLSYVAAYKLGIIAKGSAEVEVEGLSVDNLPPPIAVNDTLEMTTLPPSLMAPETKNSPPTIYLQLAAFQSPSSAESFLMRMRAAFENSGKQVVLYQKSDRLVRVHIGPYATHDEARIEANKIETKLGFRPFLSIH